MAKSKIEWTDQVWNPVVGCKKVSPGCAHCYAERLAKRLAAMGQKPYQAVTNEFGWNKHVECLPDRLEQPYRWRKPSRVFVNSMSDLFHPDVPLDFILRCWITMARTPEHTYQILTKRADRMMMFINDWLPGAWGLATTTMQILDEPVPNIWLGVSVENQQAADERIPLLLETPAAVRFLSVEPMLGPIDLFSHKGEQEPISPYPNKLDLVICGVESGPRRRKVDINDIRSLRDQCTAAGIKFFLKQMDINDKLTKMPELDGKVWNELPEAQ